MAIKTGISFCDSTVNPIMGCEGCELWVPGSDIAHCYAKVLVDRYKGRNGWPDDFSKPKFFPGRIEKAAYWKDLTGTIRPSKLHLNHYPRIIFVNDLSDTWISAPDAEGWLPDLMPIMEDSMHIWMFVTKRPWEMYRFFERHGPVPDNFWLGVTVTSKETLSRLRALVRIEASVRFVSFEPLLGPIPPDDLKHYLGSYNGIDWSIVGFESGTHARPGHPNWARNLRDIHAERGIPFFFKQWGEWYPSKLTVHWVPKDKKICVWSDGRADTEWSLWDDNDGEVMLKIGRARTGSLLDKEYWHQMPLLKGAELHKDSNVNRTILY